MQKQIIAGSRLPHILVYQVFVFQERQGNDERQQDDKHCVGENQKRLKSVPYESRRPEEFTIRKLNLGQVVYFKGGFVNNVQIKRKQPAPDEKGRNVVHTTGVCEKEFEADNSNDKDQGS